ncbi:MAG: hypothetical protein K2G31_04200 [Clostridia bacterium]|nr:hypothetical protein [Clostridia bacterium]
MKIEPIGTLGTLGTLGEIGEIGEWRQVRKRVKNNGLRIMVKIGGVNDRG